MSDSASLIDVYRRNGERIFIVDAQTDETFTYQEFQRLVYRFVRFLRERGLDSGDRLIILLENSPEFACVYFACLHAGIVAVPVNPNLHSRDLRYIFEVSGSSAALVSNRFRSILESVEAIPASIEVIGIDTARSGGPSPFFSQLPSDDEDPRSGADPDKLAVITFTSGTTGRPKGVCHSTRTLTSAAAAFDTAVGLEAGDRLLHVLPMSYMAGFLNTLLCPFLTGATVIIDECFDARTAFRFWDSPVKYGADFFWLVPSILTMLLKVDRSNVGAAYARDNLRRLCVGTAPLPLALRKEFEDRYGVRCLESYGLSETLFVATENPDGEAREGSVGRPLNGVVVTVEGSEGQSLAPGEPGDIHIASPFNMIGYLEVEDSEPDIRSAGGAFPSGDVGYLDSDGFLFITDRKKDLIIRGGVNISPRAVEEVLAAYESISAVAVVGMPHDLYGEEVVAAIQLSQGNSLDAVLPGLRAHAKANLSEASVPTRFIQLASLPLGSTGKVSKKEVRLAVLAASGGQQQ